MQTSEPATEYLTPAQVAARFALRAGQRMSPSTVTRWVFRGLLLPDGQRIRLPARRIGRALVIAPSDLDEFFAALNPTVAEPTAQPPRTANQRSKASAKAAARLNRRGVGV